MKALTAILLCSLLAACGMVAPTAYQSDNFTGGFSHTQLAPDTWRVRFSGNGFTSEERSSDFVMLRAAEMMLENGYRYFRLTDSETGSRPVSTSEGTVYKPRNSVVAVGLNERTEDTFDSRFITDSIRQKYDLSE